MENNNTNYELTAYLQFIIKEEFDWTVNVGYETKEQKEGTLLISNKNNVKGLEFPFVICIMQGVLTNNYNKRKRQMWFSYEHRNVNKRKLF